MNKTTIEGAFLIESEPVADDRGQFAVLYSAPELEERGLPARFIRSAISRNFHAGTLRGLHYQASPHAETKLVTCLRGAIFDVLVDVREDSRSAGQWEGFQLEADGDRSLLIPPGVAHGFQTLVDDTEVLYHISAGFVPEAERGIRWNDARLAIEWPRRVTIISEKDERLPLFTEQRP